MFENFDLTYHWSIINLIIKKRKRGKRGGTNTNLTRQKKTIRSSYNFPRFLYTNACSLSSEKHDTLQWFSLDYDVICITETWNNGNRDLSLNNFQLYETCRIEKGGGTAVYVRSDMHSAKYNNFIYNNSKDYEITCVTIRPNYMPRSVSVLAVVCVYVPPNSKKSVQFKLFHSLCSIYENIRQKYKEPCFVIQGDFNRWKFTNVFSNTTLLKQIVQFPTFINATKTSKLDYIFTNITELYNEPACLIPLKTTPMHHVCIELLPKKSFESKATCHRIIKYRDYTKDNLSDFAQLIENFNWNPFYKSNCINFKVRYMDIVISNAFEVAFKEKEKKVRCNNNLWVTKPLEQLFRRKKKYHKNTSESVQLEKEIVKEIRKAKIAYNKTIQNKISSKKESLHSIANKLCNLKRKISPVEKIALCDKLSLRETLNKINTYFAEINNRYKPLGEVLIGGLNESDKLSVNEFAVLRSFEKLNIRKSNVPGALPVRFLKFAAVHIVPLYTHIINFSFSNICVPAEWKNGYITPVPKDPSNMCIENLRPITQTNVYCKIMEEFMFHKIYSQVIAKLNPNQFGAIKKSSTAHYLISLFDFVLKSLDTPNTYIIIVLLDLSKAFDLVDHNNLIRCLIDIGIPSSDILWIAEFLRNRHQCTRHQNQISEFISISNSTPQGTKIAILLFVILVNELLNAFHEKFARPKNLMHAFVDDMCIAEAVTYTEAPQMNDYVNEINKCMVKNKMCLNAKKSSVLVIDNSKDKKFSDTNISINGEVIPKVNISKLLGVLINVKTDWSDHIDDVYSKACKKLFILRKLKCFGLSRLQLVNMYVLHVRSILEYCCVLWASALTKVKKLVSVEKRALSIITKTYVSSSNYLKTCKTVQITCLTERWVSLTTSFGVKTLINDRFKHWFETHKIDRSLGFSD